MKPILADEIKHLSKEQIEELYSSYLAGEKNADLVKKYNISVNPNKLISIIPPIEREDRLCPYCEVSMFAKRRSKSASSWHDFPVECLSCGHKEYEANRFGYIQECRCSKCLNKIKEQNILREQRAREIILKEYNIDGVPLYSYSDLKFSHKLYLLTLFRMQTSEDFEFIQAYDDPRRVSIFSPTRKMDLEIIKSLFQDGVLAVDPQSEISGFVEEEDFKSFYIERVRWIVNVTFDGVNRFSLGDTFHILYNDFLSTIQPSWKDEVFRNIYYLSREEVMQYIAVKTEELRVDFSAENKTREVVTKLLNNFSVSEIYYFAKKAVENAHIYFSKGYSKGKKHAANTIPGKMLELGERAISENWNTYRYNRDSRAPRSALSVVLYDLLFQGDDDGFTKSPEKYWEQELFPKYFSSNEEEDKDIVCAACNAKNISIQMANDEILLECFDCGHLSEYHLRR